MPLTKSRGNMYPWVTHTHSHLRGACPHCCSYCYVQAIERKFNNGHYSGPLRLDESELQLNYGVDKVIFIEHCNDLFADKVPSEWIMQILSHCHFWHRNTYIFQTKNPARAVQFIASKAVQFPQHFMVGITLESNLWHDVMGSAPHPKQRIAHFKRLRSSWPQVPTFITIEPVLDFNPVELFNWIESVRPSFVNIGADSKGHGLVEPDERDVIRLIELLQEGGIQIRQKKNLGRLINNEVEPR